MNGVHTLSAINSRPTAAIIADQLRESIISGAFAPGDQINEAQVAAQLNVSRGPVREALHRLVQEGLLLARPNRGVFVKEVTSRDIAEVAEAREVIECAAAEVITNRDVSARERTAARLTAITVDMQAAADARDWNRLRRSELQFHTALVDEGNNTRLARAYATLATESLICMAQGESAYPHPENVVPEHLAIIESLLAADMEAVHLALHDHLSIDDYQLHSHDPAEALRHGRPEDDLS